MVGRFVNGFFGVFLVFGVLMVAASQPAWFVVPIVVIVVAVLLLRTVATRRARKA